MNDYEWEPINFQLKIGYDYLGQVYKTYPPAGANMWRAVLTFYPEGADFFDLLDAQFSTSDEAKAAANEALTKHRASAAAGGVS